MCTAGACRCTGSTALPEGGTDTAVPPPIGQPHAAREQHVPPVPRRNRRTEQCPPPLGESAAGRLDGRTSPAVVGHIVMDRGHRMPAITGLGGSTG